MCSAGPASAQSSVHQVTVRAHSCWCWWQQLAVCTMSNLTVDRVTFCEVVLCTHTYIPVLARGGIWHDIVFYESKRRASHRADSDTAAGTFRGHALLRTRISWLAKLPTATPVRTPPPVSLSCSLWKPQITCLLQKRHFSSLLQCQRSMQHDIDEHTYIHVFRYVRIHIYIHIYMFAYTHTRLHTHTYGHTNRHAHTLTHTHEHARTHTHTHSCTYLCVCFLL